MTAPLLFTLRTKGASGLVSRVATVATRFGPTPQIMMRRLERMIEVAASAGFGPSCPITATVLARHPDGVRALVDRGMEIAVHGLRHNDHLTLDADSQLAEIGTAVEVFRSYGIEPTGFRAPYLRSDERTAAAVRGAGLDYQSDDAVVFATEGVTTAATATDAYQRAIEMYDARDAALVSTRPSLVDGLVRIPVCLPDDEMLVDRLHLGDHQLAQSWCSILDSTRAQQDLFTMQIHPERFIRSVDAVEAVLQRAGSAGDVWCARLDEIAQWWRARAKCRIESAPADDGTTTFTLHGDLRAHMRLVGGGQGVGSPATRSLTRPDGPLPMVFLADDAAPTARAFLEEDGFLLADPMSCRASDCAVELDGRVDAGDQLGLRAAVLAGPHPVLAIDRWPDGRRSAFALTGDIDALTMQDFAHRMRENTHGAPSWITERTS